MPPFPGSQPRPFLRAGASEPLSDAELDKAARAAARLKVGGTFWAAQPPLPGSGYRLVRVSNSTTAARLSATGFKGPHLFWSDKAAHVPEVLDRRATVLTGECDPWHLLSGATGVVVERGDELAVLAAIAGVPVRFVGDETDRPELAPGTQSLRKAFFSAAAERVSYLSPFTGDPMGLEDAIELLGFWRKIIDSNRDIGAAVGFAFWKRPTVAPLLWDGSGGVPFRARAEAIPDGKLVAVWRSRAAPALLAELERKHAKLAEVEDGFIRSAGLGADCVPPLSIIVDPIGVYFDSRSPSLLEELIEKGEFDPALVERARVLRELIVELGISKYASEAPSLERRRSNQRHILVPGQVEDDRAVLSSGDEVIGNAELLRRVRLSSPDAYIIYKPHPDVEAGHRVGAIPDDLSSQLADEIVRTGPISSLIAMVDEVHVNSSLAGFEALLRGKAVTTHGVPFYAGWGVTRDLGKVPERRTAKRSPDELVAAALLLYPRYLDPVSGLPCPPEILIRRLSQGGGVSRPGAVVHLRRLQGRVRRRLAAIRFW
jgi:capsular polysaccharide export protein